MLFACGTANVFAEENDEEIKQETMTFDFEEFQFQSEDIYAEKSRTEYEKIGNKEIYTVYDRETNEITDVISVEIPEYSLDSINPNAHTAFFTRDKYINGNGQNAVTLRFTACVSYYSNGSFRSFEAVRYTDVSIIAKATDMYLSSNTSSAWSHTGSFPCSQLDFAYTVNIIVTGNVNAGLSVIFINAGFSQSSYYYKWINESGSFNLYS